MRLTDYKALSFDCYGTLIYFQMAPWARRLFADRIAPEQMDAFCADFSAYRLDEVLDTLVQLATVPRPPALYVGSTTVDTCLPGFRADNDLGFGPRHPLASVWLGNRSRIAAHFDLPDNLACVVAGMDDFIPKPLDVDLLYTALLGIPRDLYEAAKVDGAGAWRRFVDVTFPLLVPAALTVEPGLVGAALAGLAGLSHG